MELSPFEKLIASQMKKVKLPCASLIKQYGTKACGGVDA
jgi:hypothetical protein